MKKKILSEYAGMANAERQVSGIGPGAKDEPFVQIPLNLSSQLKFDPNVQYPFEINNNIKKRFTDIFEYVLELRNQFQAALENPTVKKKKSKQIGIKNAINELDNINKKLIEIPDRLSQIFKLDK